MESQLQNSNGALKQLRITNENNEEEIESKTGFYDKLYSQFNQLQSKNSFNIKEIEELRAQLAEMEAENIELRENIGELNGEVG